MINGRTRQGTALLMAAVLLFAEGCRSFQPARPSDLTPDSWISVRSDRPFAVTMRPPDGSAPGAPCPVTSLEGRVRAFSADTLHVRLITNAQFTAEAEVHCFASTAGHLLFRADSSRVVSSARYDAHRTRFLVVTIVILVGVIAMSFATADWGYDLSSGFEARAPEGR